MMISSVSSQHCPHQDPFLIGGIPFSAADIVRILGPMLLPSRRARIDETVAGRTYSIVPVLEGLYDRGNVSAVLRTAEALGFQSVHVIDSSMKFKEANRVTQGAEKWLDLHLWPGTVAGLAHLKRLGYRIAVTHFEGATPIDAVDFNIPTAVLFGNEKDGVSNTALDAADLRMVIPMPGFTRSFNISVAAALCLYHIRQARLRQQDGSGDLDPECRRRLTASYYLRSLPHAERVLLRGQAAAAELP
jgi:tRNA (guanosine-2'-O-)-methyltransferase